MTITAVSVLVALVVGSIEALGFIAEHTAAGGGFWDEVRNLNGHFALIGYVIIGLFILSWAVSVLIYRLRVTISSWRPSRRSEPAPPGVSDFRARSALASPIANRRLVRASLQWKRRRRSPLRQAR